MNSMPGTGAASGKARLTVTEELISMTYLEDMVFRRRFSVNPYKSLSLPLGRMDCHKDWLSDTRGDPYPVTGASGQPLREFLDDGRYAARNDTADTQYVSRLLGQHFPYATYEFELREKRFTSAESGVGLELRGEGIPTVRVLFGQMNGQACVRCEENGVSVGRLTAAKPLEDGACAIVTCRGRYLDIYIRFSNEKEYIGAFEARGLTDIIAFDVFTRSTASLCVTLAPGDLVVCGAAFCLEGGISHADIKVMKTENGEAFMENGRVFLTLSSRLQAGGFQSVVSWEPSTCDIRMEGALFFDTGDGRWCSDVATSAVFDRRAGIWYVWACSFSHGHVLCRGISRADIRHGIHVIDVKLMDAQREVIGAPDSLGAIDATGPVGRATLDDDTLFLAKFGDEDPDLTYDEARKKWLLGVCRLVATEKGDMYRYFIYESDSPLDGFRHIGHTNAGSTTGGSFVRVGDRRYLVCGSSFDRRAQYHLYQLNDLSKHALVRFDYDDGGFRGWGTIMPLPCGGREKYVMLTFDRHNGSDYNWSYGNIYVFEADVMNRME